MTATTTSRALLPRGTGRHAAATGRTEAPAGAARTRCLLPLALLIAVQAATLTALAAALPH